MKKTKIICTIGPSSESPHILENLIKAGMDVARLNFSHGTKEDHLDKIRLIRHLSKETGKPVAILQDLGGPKIRIGPLPKEGITLKPGSSFILTGRAVEGTEESVSTSYPDLAGEVKPGDRILLADGIMELSVKEIKGKDIVCQVITGGILTSHKGINLPDGTIKVPSLTQKDKEDLLFGIEHGVDYVALSFVRDENDILNIKKIINSSNSSIPVIAKIEKHEAIKNIDRIIEVSDGIMVARGDLGVEIPLEDVPLIQKTIIRKANLSGKPVVTATQMLRSMVNSPRPTRAEATDVANAVLDGTDALMLSEETATGNYPVEALKFMVRIVEKAEKSYPHSKYLELIPKEGIEESVAHASCVLADHLMASAIIATTRSGNTARLISRFRPQSPVIALSPDPSAVNQLTINWGCYPKLIEMPDSTDDMLDIAVSQALSTGYVKKGDIAVITAGHPVWVSGTTNMLRVKRL
jgi:pyruvate kinase